MRSILEKIKAKGTRGKHIECILIDYPTHHKAFAALFEVNAQQQQKLSEFEWEINKEVHHKFSNFNHLREIHLSHCSKPVRTPNCAPNCAPFSRKEASRKQAGFFSFFGIIALALLFSLGAKAERGVNVDVNGFIDSTTTLVTHFANGIAGAAVALTCIGLMIPGFREVARRSLPWTALGVIGIIVVTKFWR